MIVRPATPSPFPITEPSSEAAVQAAALHSAWCDQHARIERVEREHADAQRAVQEADAALQAALDDAESKGKTSKAVSDAEAAYAAAKEAARGPWDQRLSAAIRETAARQGAYNQCVNENFEELLAELRPEGEEAREAILEAAKALTDAVDRWSESRAAHMVFVKSASGLNGSAVPYLEGNAKAAAVAAERLLAEQFGERATPVEPLSVPAPTPRALKERRIRLGLEAPEKPTAPIDRVSAALLG
jgi:hypothetical protein